MFDNGSMMHRCVYCCLFAFIFATAISNSESSIFFISSVLQLLQLPQSTFHPPQYHSAIYPHMASISNEEGAGGEGVDEYLRLLSYLFLVLLFYPRGSYHHSTSVLSSPLLFSPFNSGAATVTTTAASVQASTKTLHNNQMGWRRQGHEVQANAQRSHQQKKRQSTGVGERETTGTMGWTRRRRRGLP